MQLPGMSTEPVRVSIEVTFWPHDDSWSLARRTWRRSLEGDWRMEEMSTTGTPMGRHACVLALDAAVAQLSTEMIESEDPFGDSGPFIR